jgi:hypothetical protein
VDIVFDLGDAGFPAYAPATASNYRLLKRPDPSGPFLELATASSIMGDQIVFGSVTVADLGSNFTVATVDNTQSPLGPAPTAIQLASLVASCAPNSGVSIVWETATEIDNVGFNLYRSTAAGGPKIRLNEDLIPTQHPGRPTGAEYTWLDSSAIPGTFYYYWLEDIDTNGAAGLHGPVSMTLPGAVPGYRAFLPIMRK